MDVRYLVGDLESVDSSTASLGDETFTLPIRPDEELGDRLRGHGPGVIGTPSFPPGFRRGIEATVPPEDDATVLRLTLRSAASHLLDLEWEMAEVSFAGTQQPVAAHDRLLLVREVVPSRPPQEPARRALSPHAVLVVCLPDADEMTVYLQKLLQDAGFTVRMCRSASLADVEAAISQPVSLLCFLGHGTPDGLILRHATGSRVETPTDFATAISRNPVDLVLLLSCDSASGGGSAGGSVAHHLAAAGVRVAVGMQRPIPIAAAKVYAAAFFDRWAQRGTVDETLLAARKALSRTEISGMAFVPVAFTSLGSEELGRLRMASRRSVNRVACDLLHCDWDLEGTPPVPAARRRLDTFLVLNRNAFTEVVADLSDLATPLADELNVAELDFEHYLAPSTIKRRQWFDLGRNSVDVTAGLDEVRRSKVRDATGWTDATSDESGAGTGFVLNVDARAGSLTRTGPVRTTVERLRQLLPNAAVIVQYTAEQPVDAVAAGRDFGQHASSSGLVPGASRFLIIQPLSHDNVPGSFPAGGLPELVAAVRSEMDKRGFNWLTEALHGGGRGSLPHPIGVIEGLNTSEPPLALDDEVKLLRAVRVFFPRYYVHLLRQHACRRHEEGVWAGLVAAADDDDHLEEWWLDGGHRAAHSPFPPGLITAQCVEAVLVRLLCTRATRPAIERWLQHGGRVAHEVFGMTQENGDGWTLDLDRATGSFGVVAELAARVAARLGVRPVDVERACGTPFFWALAGRTGLVELVRPLSAEVKTAFTAPLGPLPTTNLEERERREQLRDAMWSPGLRKWTCWTTGTSAARAI